jgi:hypothetical protein
MIGKVMRPFRAPREARKRSKGISVTCQADVATQEATPDLLQASSQEETALGTVRKPWQEKTWVVQETQHPEEEPNTVGDEGDEGAECVQGSLTIAASTQAQGTQSVVSSPSLSEFDDFLEAMEARRAEIPKIKPANINSQNS